MARVISGARPTISWRRSILWAFAVGFVLQIAVPEFLISVGAGHAAFYAMLVGFLPAMMATKSGWNSNLSVLGYLITFTINTAVYGLVSLILLRAYFRLMLRKARFGNKATSVVRS